MTTIASKSQICVSLCEAENKKDFNVPTASAHKATRRNRGCFAGLRKKNTSKKVGKSQSPPIITTSPVAAGSSTSPTTTGASSDSPPMSTSTAPRSPMKLHCNHLTPLSATSGRTRSPLARLDQLGISLPFISPIRPSSPASPVLTLFSYKDFFSNVSHSECSASSVSPASTNVVAHETDARKVTDAHAASTLRRPAALCAGGELAFETNASPLPTPSPIGNNNHEVGLASPRPTPACSPLPAYLDPLEDLEIRDSVVARSEEALQQFTDLLVGAHTWKDCGTKQGVKVAKSEVKGSAAFIKGTYTFTPPSGATPSDVIAFLWDNNPKQYNDTVEASFRLRNWNHSLCTYYQCYKGSMGVQGRDFCLYGSRMTLTTDIIANGAPSNSERLLTPSKCVPYPPPAELQDAPAIFVSQSCDWKQTSEMLAPRVRASCNIGGVHCRRIEGGQIEVCQIWQADLGGSLPEMVKKAVALQSVQSLAPAMKLFVKNYRA